MSLVFCARVSGVLALALTLGSCAQLPWSRVDESGNSESFEMLGRVYVRYGARAFAGSLRWHHAVVADEVWIGGPLGQGAAHIVRDSSGATLTTADQQVYRSTSIEALTRQGLGWTLPLADLSFYVVGKVPPDAAAGAERDATGRIVRATRDGWSVRWSPLEPGAEGAMRARIELSKEDVEIRIVVDRLDIGAAA